MMFKRYYVMMLCFGLALGLQAQNNFDGQIKKMCDNLAEKIIRSGKKRVAIADFTDLQGAPTELGKYIAEMFSVELSNTDLEVVDRSQINKLRDELKMTEQKMTDPANALALGKMTGVQYIITGTTIPLDNTVDVTVKALDIQQGISIGGQKGSLPRTDAINNLMRSTVNSAGGQPGANVNMGKPIDTRRSPGDDIFEATVRDLRPVDYISTGPNGIKLYAGQVCFENQTGFDLSFSSVYYGGGGGVQGWEKLIGIPNGSRNCTGQVVVNYEYSDAQSIEINFKFQTTRLERNKSGWFKVTIEKGKVKSFVLTTTNLMLQ